MKNPANYGYCGDKKRYQTDPGMVITRDGIRLWSYRCPKCQKWHLTSQRPISAEAAVKALFKEST